MADTEALTFERVWAMSQETDRRMKEAEWIVKENAKQMGRSQSIMIDFSK